jgi:subtilase family serine protease
MHLRPIVAVAAALLLVGVPSTSLAPRSPASPAAHAPPVLTAYAAAVPAGSQLAPLSSGLPLLLTFTLGFSNESRLDALLAAVSDPSSPDYRHFLTYAQFQQEFGPSRAAFESVESALRASGATELARAAGGTSIDAVLPVSAAERLLDVRFLSVSGAGGPQGYTEIGPPTLPSSFAERVSAVDGLSRLASRSEVVTAAPLTAPLGAGAASPSGYVRDGTTGEQWFIGTDYAQAYGATTLLPGINSVRDATYPTGVAIATLLASGYNYPTATSLPPWDPAVVDAYYNETFPAGWPLPRLTGVPVSIFGAGAPLPPETFRGLNDSLGFEVENSLDLEMAGSLAPGAQLYNFYFNGSLLYSPLAEASIDQYFATDLGQALSQDYGYARLAVVSCSFGIPNLVNGQWDSELATAAAMGVTIVSASGDQGNAPSGATGRNEGPAPVWPATASFNTSGAVAVGGVSISLSGKPTSTYTFPPIAATYDAQVQGIASSTAWWQGSGGFGTFAGTEGGVSINYTEPSWQFHSAAQPPIVNATEIQRSSQLGRSEPDVAFAANTTIAYIARAGSTPEFEVLGGTSVAAPVFAGMLADVVAVENQSLPGGRTGLGFLDPELYRIASYFQAHPGSNNPFRDVVTGHNFLFEAAPGWDPLTGWGEIFAPLLLLADENSTVANYVYVGPTPGLPAPVQPLLTPFEVVAIFAGAAAAVLAAVYLLLASRRAPRSRSFDPSSVPPPAPPMWDSAPAPVAPYASFACPYCGAERPAEPGHCPACGAM